MNGRERNGQNREKDLARERGSERKRKKEMRQTDKHRKREIERKAEPIERGRIFQIEALKLMIMMMRRFSPQLFFFPFSNFTFG